MTTAIAQPDAPAAETEQVSVGVDDLIIGRPIQHPIYDEKGTLLLAAGTVISSEFKRLLRQHKLPEVLISKEDAAQVVLAADILENTDAFCFHTALTKEFDKLIDGGLPPVANTGAAVRDGMVSLGKNGYDAKQRDRLVEKNKENTRALSDMMQSAAEGGRVDGAVASDVASYCLYEMRSDIENVLTSEIGAYDDDCMSAQALQTSMLAMAIGIELGLDTDNVKTIGTVGLVHDWGMMKVPKRVRSAPHPLSAEDYHEIQKHPIYSLEMLQQAQSIPGLVSVISYQIHERPDGSGYPRGRSTRTIHQFARIVAVADTYVAMTNARYWRKPFMAYAAMECILRETQRKHLDATAVRALLQVLSLFPIGSLVALTDGSVARVMRRNGTHYTSPIVCLLQDAQGQRVDAATQSRYIDLSQSELKVAQALPTPGREEVPLSEAISLLGYQDSIS